MAKISLFNMCEFIYDGIVRRGRNYLFELLDREDFLKVRNDSKIKKFVENAKLDDLLIFLSKIGFGCGIILWDKELEKKKKVQDVLIAYIDTDPNNVAKQIIKDRVFAAADIDIIKGLQVISKASNSKVYTVNRKYTAIKDYALKARTIENKLEAERNLDWYSKTIQFALDIEPILEAFKIDMQKFRTLLALQTAPNGMLRDSIARKLNRTNVTGMLNEMYDTNLIHLSGENKNIATIGVYGVIILEKILTKFP